MNGHPVNNAQNTYTGTTIHTILQQTIISTNEQKRFYLLLTLKKQQMGSESDLFFIPNSLIARLNKFNKLTTKFQWIIHTFLLSFVSFLCILMKLQ